MLDFKKFLKVGKNYIDYIMKLGFKELFVNFIELIILAILSLLIIFPVEAIKVLLPKIIRFSGAIADIYNIIFLIGELIVGVCFFIYMFNKRYEDIEKIRGSRRDNFVNNNEQDEFKRDHVEKEDIELPKMADKKRF